MLADLDGQPMLRRVWERVRQAGCFDRVIVAADDPRVASVAAEFGAEVVLTGTAPSGTHRVAGVSPPDVTVLNVQADQPLVDPEHLRLLVRHIRAGWITTLVGPRVGDGPAHVRAVLDGSQAVDFLRHGPAPLQHIGVYGFAPGMVHRCAEAPRRGRAARESLEQLAWLDAELPIRAVRVERCPTSVDTPEQLASVRAEIVRCAC